MTTDPVCAFCKQKFKLCRCGAERELKRDKQFAAAFMRRSLGRYEQRLYDLLEADPVLRGRFTAQVACYGYVLDFYCEALRLGIEVDGSVHGARIYEDQQRDLNLFNRGIRILRFNNGTVESEPHWVTDQVRFAVRVLEPRREKLG